MTRDNDYNDDSAMTKPQIDRRMMLPRFVVDLSLFSGGYWYQPGRLSPEFAGDVRDLSIPFKLVLVVELPEPPAFVPDARPPGT